MTGATAERWKRVYLLAQRLSELPPDARESLARKECADDVSVAEEALRIANQSFSEDDPFLDFSPVGAAPAARSGRRIGPWRVVRELGRGGMGQVLLAERDDGKFTKQVALKLVNGFAIGELRERLLRERQILAGLEHPGIARLLDGGETDDGSPYLAMEYVEGRALDVWREAENPTIGQILKLFLEICAAVEFAHRNMIVHRDLKPSNILVTGDGHARLLDFGIAKLLEHAGAAADFTVVGTGQMSMAYASPEQADGRRVTAATDVYSLGVVLYELVTGQLPYAVRGLPVLDAIRVVCQQEPVPAGRLAAQARGDVEAILTRALEKEPGRRYSSVQDFRRDVERYLEGRAIHARPSTWLYRTGKVVRRNLWQFSASAVLLAAIVTGTATTLLQHRRANQRGAEVRELANKMLSGYLVSLAEIPGSAPLRRQMADDASRYLDRLAADAPASDDLARDVAAAYHLLAEAQGAGDGHIGDFAGALKSIRRAIAIRESLLARRPRDPERQFDLAWDLRPLATVYTNTQDARTAETSVRLLAAVDGLPPAWLEKTKVRELLSTALSYRSWVLSSYGKPDEAIVIERRRLEVCERLANESPGSPAAQIRLSDAQVRLSVDLFEARRFDESVEAAQRAVALLGRTANLVTATRRSSQRSFRAMLAAAYKGVGKPELMRGRWRDAEKALGLAAVGCEKLVAEEAGDRRSVNCLAESLLWQARAMQLLRDPRARQVAAHYVSVALASFEATHAGEDADPFDVDLWLQAADWGLPLSVRDEPALLKAFERLAPQARNRTNWSRWELATKKWKSRN